SPPPADASLGYLAETVVTIQTGDTLWALSEDRLLTADAQPARPAVTVAYAHQAIAATPETLQPRTRTYHGRQIRYPALAAHHPVRRGGVARALDRGARRRHCARLWSRARVPPGPQPGGRCRRSQPQRGQHRRRGPSDRASPDQGVEPPAGPLGEPRTRRAH